MRDCPGKPSTTRTAEGPHSSGVGVVSSSGSGRPARAHIRPNAAANTATAGPQTATIVSRQHAREAAGHRLFAVHDEQLTVVAAERGDRTARPDGAKRADIHPGASQRAPVGAA